MENLVEQAGHADGAAKAICQPMRASIDDLPERLRNDLIALGPLPMRTLTAFVDLGLSDAEIARYFDLPAASIAKLRTIWQLR
ncbi:hypothetical protein PM03_04240 [Thalassobacter stenotrophicus]|uniref:hypothetical protein n=1 Tax=Thalassobacter TaxID=266808 RepID=UPI00051D8323|nr:MULTISPECIES: hypothetical protein [Thalassobacter]KGK79896.1 hypothetical protein PM03_04240 [Thalassobacter stenotrophicus]KGL03127.1 hypothetical protein PM04_01010 [Thalassobacter sp. 16PALIMAR09]